MKEANNLFEKIKMEILLTWEIGDFVQNVGDLSVEMHLKLRLKDSVVLVTMILTMTSHCIMSYWKRMYIFEIMEQNHLKWCMCMDVFHNTNRANPQVI